MTVASLADDLIAYGNCKRESRLVLRSAEIHPVMFGATLYVSLVDRFFQLRVFCFSVHILRFSRRHFVLSD